MSRYIPSLHRGDGMGVLVFVVNLMVELGDEVFEYLQVYITHGILLLCILANLGNPCTTGLYVVLVDVFDVLFSQFGKTVVVENHVV